MAGKNGMRKRVSLGGTHDRARMWNSMRQLRSFTSADIAATAETSTNGACKYCRHLFRSGYLAITCPKREGVPQGHTVYRLVRNTGPVAPRISKGGLYDANLSDPNEAPRNKRIAKHANALHKALRDLLDVVERMDLDNNTERPSEAAYQHALRSSRELLAQIDGAAS